MSHTTTTEDMPDNRSAIEVVDLRKEFQTPSGIEVAVDDISFEIGEQEFITVVGPSGCGKTTTLRCLAGLETPTSGMIRFEGEDVSDVPAHKRSIAMMFQNIALYPHMKIVDNISYPLKVRRVPKEERYEQAREAAEIMQIPELLEKYPAELSGGQRQRAALARTIVQDPKLFLLDEPLSDLDAKLKVEIRKEIQRVHKRVEKPTVYVTHDQEEAMSMSDRIVVLNNGQIEQVGTPGDLYNKPNNKFVAEFIGNPSINFFNGTVESAGQSECVISIYGEQFTIDLNESTTQPNSSKISIGIRPEDLDLSKDSSKLDAKIILIERISELMLATLEGPDGELRSTLPAESPFQEDESVSLDLRDTTVHIFDNETGEAFGQGVIVE